MDFYGILFAEKLSGGSGGGGGGIDMSSLKVFIGDYTNDPYVLTLGSVDKYYRRIYGQ